ncbi:MAG: DUF1553 domain-containing protein [Planctomycetota bacterium]|nr:DUF1553 domain-containing protein [Planctomycetota bacterium]
MNCHSLKKMSRLSAISCVLLAVCIAVGRADDSLVMIGDLQVQPAELKLDHRRHPHSINVTIQTADGQLVDLTSQATFQSSDENVAKVNLLGWVQPINNGAAQITVQAAGRTAAVKLAVTVPDAPRPYSFQHDVMPVLSKAGCNAGACHGYSLGKNGFKLSLRGSDPAYDYKAITDEFLERRVNRHNPAASLILGKPLGDVPHEGGIRIERDSLLHEYMLGWITGGAKSDLDDPATLESIRIYPENVVLRPDMQQQLQLLAEYSDGSIRDVTRLGIYNVNTTRIAEVTDEGLVTANELGETAVVARFERIFATSNFIVLQPSASFQPTPVPEDNVIDKFVVRKLNRLNITPSELAGDEMFLRRVYVDVIGLQPTPEQLQAFLADAEPNRRSRLIDSLFDRPEFVDQWSMKWGDLLQISRNQLSEPAMFAFREWLRGSIAENRPLDQIVRHILTSRGGLADDPTSAYFVASKDTDDTLQRATQVFCGVRMLCAKCHPHPFENWTQGDYYGLHSFFNQVTTKADPRQTGVPNAKSVLVNLAAGYSQNPRTSQLQPPRFLGGEEPEIAAGTDRRKLYAEWLTSKDNAFFGRSMTNRIWSYFFHRGIIDPVDDLRTTNPPINPELLDALTQDFVDHDFDMRHLMRTITNSQTYQRGSIANDTNAHDDMNFSHAIPRRLPAEALLDSLVQATGVPEQFPGAPANFTAKQLPDANVQSEFLALFGKPQRMEACECERDTGSNMLQALHFINGQSILSRVAAANGRVAQLLKEEATDDQLVTKLYLWSLCRQPTPQEVEVATAFIKTQGEQRKEAAEDLMWALLNSHDFVLLY